MNKCYVPILSVFCFYQFYIHYLTGWRPAFKFYSKWVALAGSGTCLAIMFVISWWAALVTLVAVGALYFIVYWRKPGTCTMTCVFALSADFFE